MSQDTFIQNFSAELRKDSSRKGERALLEVAKNENEFLANQKVSGVEMDKLDLSLNGEEGERGAPAESPQPSKN